MEHLCEAAVAGDTNSLEEIVRKDKKILHKVAAGCFNGTTSPLHIATSCEQADFVKALLSLKPELKLRLTEVVLDSQLRSALHLASAQGHDEIVKVLVDANPKMCLVRDRDGKTPVHVAAMEGNVDVLELMVNACPQAARVSVDQNETILHLCVKHNQPESLKKILEMIPGRDFVDAKDSDGNTILHLAILYKHFEVLSRILEKKTIDVNITNASGHTAMDIFLFGSYHEQRDEVDHIDHNQKQMDDHTEDLLLQANARRAKDLVGSDWLTKKRDSLMVVASLIATMAYQAVMNPPGGVWQEDTDRAGQAVMAYRYPDSYQYFLRFSTTGFVASLSTILLLISGFKFRTKAEVWILVVVTMWVAITSVAVTFAYASVVITPKVDRRSLAYTIKIGVIVWFGVMSLLLVYHTVNLVTNFVKEKRSKKKAIERIVGFKPPSLPLLCKIVCLNHGGATPPRSISLSCVKEHEGHVLDE